MDGMKNQPKRAFSGPELCRLEAHAVVAMLRAGEVDAAELLAASRARVEAVDDAVNAMPMRCFERAMRQLDAWRAGAGAGDGDNAGNNTVTIADNNAPGELGGLPIGIKDLNHVAGVPTTFGTLGLRDNVPVNSDPLVERLEARGALIVGKTNTPEFGAGGNTFNAVYGATRNPWDTRRNAGGSSGGSAAALATGQVWLAHGSDLAGSLRTPAAYCGVVGLRPAPGRAGGGPADLLFNIDGAQGPMARSVTDCALFLDALAGFDRRAPISLPRPAESFQAAVARASPKLRVAFAPTLGGFAPVAAAVENVLREALTRLEAEGARVEEACPELTDLEQTYRVLRAMVWAAGPGKAPATVQRHYKATLRDNIDFGRALGVDDVYEMQRARSRLYARVEVFLRDYDVIACPTVGLPPGPVDEEFPTEIDGQPLTDYIEWLKFSYLATAAGLPALSLPVGFDGDGLPVGLQLIGQPRGEAELLAAARAVEVTVGGPLAPIDPWTG